MEHLFIINPAAGKGKPLEYLPLIKKVFKDRSDSYFVEITDRPGHATEIAREYTSSGDFRVYSIGGDGTLNEVLNGIAGSGSSLAIIPGGCGNDFIKSICRDYKSGDILQRTIHGSEKAIDLAKVNNRYFLNISSLGFDAQVAYNTTRHTKNYGLRGISAYLAGVVETLIKCRAWRFSIKIDEGQAIKGNFLLAAVANGRYYGGGMMPAPMAEIDDGYFDVCLAEEKSRLEIIKFLPKFIKGRHIDIEGIHLFKGRKVEIECDGDTPLNVDGEVEIARKAVFEIIPGGISVVFPLHELS